MWNLKFCSKLTKGILLKHKSYLVPPLLKTCLKFPFYLLYFEIEISFHGQQDPTWFDFLLSLQPHLPWVLTPWLSYTPSYTFYLLCLECFSLKACCNLLPYSVKISCQTVLPDHAMQNNSFQYFPHVYPDFFFFIDLITIRYYFPFYFCYCLSNASSVRNQVFVFFIHLYHYSLVSLLSRTGSGTW